MTLIEILVAMFIFLIGILGILAVFPVAMNSAGRAIGETRSNILGQTVLAQVSADCKCPYYTGTVLLLPNPGQVVVSGTISPTVTAGYFITVTSGSDEGQSRIITGINGTTTVNGIIGTTLSICPDLSPLPQPAPTPPATSPPGDSCIITKVGLPWYPAYAVGTVTSPPLPPNTYTFASNGPYTGPVWRNNQWDGYAILFTTGNCAGISRRIVTTTAPSTLTLDNTLPAGVQPVDLFAILEMHQAIVSINGLPYASLASVGMNLPSPSTGYLPSPVVINPRSGHVRAISTSTLPQASNDTIDAGVLVLPYDTAGQQQLALYDPTGQHVFALSWNQSDLWFKIAAWPSPPPPPPPAPQNSPATGGSLSSLVLAGAGWTPGMPGTTGGFRGCLAIITTDNNHPPYTPYTRAFNIANQVRLITTNDNQSVTVFPNWTLPMDWNNATDWANVRFMLREQPGNYFLVITSGRATGRAFPITGVSPGTGANGADQITCQGVDFRSLGVKAAYNGPGAVAPNDYVARNADTFTIIGVNGYPNSGYVAYSSPIDAAHPAPPAFPYPLYQLNAFGYPGIADLQTRSDTYIQTINGQETQTSHYTYACIFSGTGPLPTGPAGADIFVFRNYNSAQPAVNNQKPVGYLAGYIKRP